MEVETVSTYQTEGLNVTENGSLYKLTTLIKEEHAGYNLNTTTIIMISLYGLICLTGLVGNGLVIFVILRYNQLKTVTNIYILNLSVADSLFLIALPMLITTAITNEWVFGSSMCKLYYMLTCINNFTSTFTLVVMAVDRYLAACHPISSLVYRTVKNARIALLVIWMISFLVMLPVIMYARVVSSSCTIVWPDIALPGSKAFIIYSMLMAFVIPVILICTLYTMIVLKLWHTQGGISSGLIAKHRYTQFRKATRLVTLIITVFIICWLPYWILQLYLISRPGHIWPPPWIFRIYQVFTFLTYSNSMLNPLLYAFTNEYFRAAFVGAFQCLPEVRMGSTAPNKGTNGTPLQQLSSNEVNNCKQSTGNNNHKERTFVAVNNANPSQFKLVMTNDDGDVEL